MMGYQTNPNLSMYFSSENDDQNHQNYDPYNNLYSSTSHVDCTLSLGTPSTRLDDHHHRRFSSNSGSSNNISGDLGSWDIFHGGNTKTTSYKKNGGDNNLPRRCASCDTTSTPLWRNGPKGPKSLCNACGIRFKKEERRATARNLTNSSGGGSSTAEIPAENLYNNGGGNYYSHHDHYASPSPYFSPAPEIEYPFGCDVTAASFMSWN